MSADNWAMCPKCHNKAIKEKEEQEKMCHRQYGKMPIDKWIILKNKADAKIELEDTLKEYYCVGIYEGSDGYEFSVSYKGNCTKCDFSYEFKHKEENVNVERPKISDGKRIGKTKERVCD